MSLLGHAEDANGNDIARVAELDASTRAQIAITQSHAEIHAGDSYMARVWLDSITAGEYLALGFTTPAIPFGHVWLKWVVEAECQLDVLEAPVNTPGVNPVVVAYNRNRNSANLSEFANLRLYDNVGVVGGISIDFGYTWAPKQAGGGGDRGVEEIELGASTVYAIRLTATANGGGLIKLSWYEHADKD